MKPGYRLLGLCLGLASLACEQAPTEVEVQRSGIATGATPLFVLPPDAAAVPAAGELWAPLRVGDGWPGTPIADLGAAVEFSPLTFGGEQHLVEPVQRDGELGLALPVGKSFRGDAVVGLATVPTPLRQGGAEVLVSQHAKLCLHVRRGVFEAPAASPVVRHRFGFALEVVPLVDPLVLLPGDELPLRVHFAGKAQPGIEVVAQRQESGARPGFRAVTSPSGHVVVRIDGAGLWLVRARHELPADEAGPGQVLHATLVFRIGGGQ